MPRQTFVLRNGKLVPKHLAKPLLGARRPNRGVMADAQDFETTDGVHITGRAGLREYQRRTGLEQIGNDSIAGRDGAGDFIGRAHEEMPSARKSAEAAYRYHKDRM